MDGRLTMYVAAGDSARSHRNLALLPTLTMSLGSGGVSRFFRARSLRRVEIEVREVERAYRITDSCSEE